MKQQHNLRPRVSFSQTALTKPNAVLSVLAAAISACYAPQSLAAEGVRQMDEVIVTARRKDEMAQEVPISMTVMTEDFLRTNNVQKVEDIGTKVPSLRVTQSGGSMNEPIITLRGQRQGEAAFNQDPAAPMYFNEIVLSPIQGANASLYDLESLQVLKGPQGTLFGRNSTGGAVMMTSKRPGYKFGGYAEVKVGNYDLYGFEGAVDVPLFEKLTTRVVAHKLDRDGYQENIANNALNGKRYRDEHSEGARLSVNFDNNSFRNLTVLSYDENKTAAAIPVATVVNKSVGLGRIPTYQTGVADQAVRDNPWKVKSDVDAKENVRNIFGSNATEYDLMDDLTVKNVFGYRKVFLANGTDIDGTDRELAPGQNLLGNPLITGTNDPILSTVATEFYSDELQLFGSAFDNSLDWISGLYWSKLAGTEDKVSTQAGQIDSALNDVLNTSYGLFVEGTYEFTDQWSLTLGARQSQEEREITVRKWSNLARTTCGIYAEGAAIGGALDPDCARTVSEKFDSTTWKTSINFTPQPGILLYGSISTGFRAGGFNTRGTSDSTLQPYDPENVMTYELGHKQDWDLGGVPVRSSMAVYFQNYEDIQNTVSFFEGGRLQTKTVNAAKAEIKGLELEITVKPTDDLTWAMSYSYVDAQFKKKNDDLSVSNPLPPRDTVVFASQVDTSGNDFTYIPKQSLTSSLTYMLPLDQSLGDISLMASVYWQDKMSTHPLKDQFPLYASAPYPWSASDIAAVTDFSEVDAYTVWNVRADWRGIMGSTFDAALYVDNVTDEEYVLGGLNVMESGGFGSYHYGAPRTFGASVKYSF
ncbi:MAG: TonB-dependent receptor [Spongiibacteraceae bacterium]